MGTVRSQEYVLVCTRRLFDTKHSAPQTGIFILKAELEETGMLCGGGVGGAAGAWQGCLGIFRGNVFVQLDPGEAERQVGQQVRTGDCHRPECAASAWLAGGWTPPTLGAAVFGCLAHLPPAPQAWRASSPRPA